MTNSVVAQGADFFWTLGDGPVVNGDVSDDGFSVGDSGSLFLYYTTNGPAMSELNVGGFLDFATSTSDVIEFTAAEAFDFNITLADSPGVPLGVRWGDSFGPGDVTGDGQQASFDAFSV